MKRFQRIVVFLVLIVVQGNVIAQKKEKVNFFHNPDSTANRFHEFRNNPVLDIQDSLTDKNFLNSWPLFGGKIRMGFGGYVKLDYIQDFNGVFDKYQFTLKNIQVPGDGRPNQGPFMNMHIRETRFHFDIRTQTKKKHLPIRFFLEFDFFNTSFGGFFQPPRLRHAFVTIGGFMFGRTWGTLTDIYSIPHLIDFAGGDAITGSRRVQVRYDLKLKERTNLAFGVEMLEFVDISGGGNVGEPSNFLPLFATRITHRFKENKGRLMFGGSVFQLRWDGQGTGPTVSNVGYGFAFTGRVQMFKNSYFMWNLSAGDGWGSNIVSQIGSGLSGFIDSNNYLVNTFSANGYISFCFQLAKFVEMNINGGYFQTEKFSDRGSNAYLGAGTGHFNLIFAPIANLNFGIEYMYGIRLNNDLNWGDAHRIQLMVKYEFGTQ